MMTDAPLPFDERVKVIQARRSVYSAISGLQLDRAAPAEAWSSLPYRPVFVGDTTTGVLHGGVVTAMLDENCGMAGALALGGAPAHRLPEAGDARTCDPRARDLLPRYAFDRLRARHRLSGLRRRAGRHRHR